MFAIRRIECERVSRIYFACSLQRRSAFLAIIIAGIDYEHQFIVILFTLILLYSKHGHH